LISTGLCLFFFKNGANVPVKFYIPKKW